MRLAQLLFLEDCASQRNLTDRGRDEARAIGEHVKRLKIPPEGERFSVVARLPLDAWPRLE